MIKIEDIKIGTKIKYKNINNNNNIEYYEVKEIKDIHNIICDNRFGNSILLCLDENCDLYDYTKNSEIIDDEEYYEFIKYFNSIIFDRSKSLFCNECNSTVITFFNYDTHNSNYCSNPNCKNHKNITKSYDIAIPEWCYIDFSNMFSAFIDTQDFCTICFYPKIVTIDGIYYCANPNCSNHI